MTSEINPLSYRQLFLGDTFPSAVIEVASDVIHDVNRAFEELTSLAVAELRGRGFREVLEQAVPWIRSDGESEVDLETSECGPWRLVRLRRARVEEHERRSERLNAMALMAAGIAHDFNNTLMAALPWADLLRRQRSEDASVQEASEHIRKAIFRARDITQQLLDFAQPATTQRARWDFVALVREQATLASSVSDGRVTITFDSAEDPIPIDVDAVQMAKVVQHLLRNAREATVGKGRIGVRVSRLESARRRENSLPEGREFATLEVQDHGTGISRDRMSQIFDPFFTTKETRHSSGLGLSVAFRSVEHHGGAVRVESSPAAGTTVRVFLPISTPVGTPDPLQPPHLLVIDDEVSITEGIKASLELSGAKITTAATGEEALALIEAGLRPDGIVLDMGLPGIKGDEVHARVRDTLPHVLIIISSGWTSSPEASRLLDGRTSLMQKPYDPEELLVEFRRFF